MANCLSRPGLGLWGIITQLDTPWISDNHGCERNFSSRNNLGLTSQFLESLHERGPVWLRSTWTYYVRLDGIHEYGARNMQ